MILSCKRSRSPRQRLSRMMLLNALRTDQQTPENREQDSSQTFNESMILSLHTATLTLLCMHQYILNSKLCENLFFPCTDFITNCLFVSIKAQINQPGSKVKVQRWFPGECCRYGLFRLKLLYYIPYLSSNKLSLRLCYSYRCRNTFN